MTWDIFLVGCAWFRNMDYGTDNKWSWRTKSKRWRVWWALDNGMTLDSAISTEEVSEVLCSRMSRIRLLTCYTFNGLQLSGSCVRDGLWRLRSRFAEFDSWTGFSKNFVAPLLCIVFSGHLAPSCSSWCACLLVHCGVLDRGHCQMPPRQLVELWARHCRVTSCGDPVDQMWTECW